jgi:hypothetical protein
MNTACRNCRYFLNRDIVVAFRALYCVALWNGRLARILRGR